jgi:ribosomal protein S12 methylthiotransferase accessory factor
VTLLDVTLAEGIPTVLATLQSSAASAPALVVAASASLDPEESVRKSLEELAHTRRYSHKIKTGLPRLVSDPPNHENVVDQVSHLNFWTDQANIPGARFLWTSERRVDFDSLASLTTGDARRDLEVLCGRVRDGGHRALVADVTTSDVKSLGLSVVHAVIPGFHPLTLRHISRVLGGRRLREMPPKMGYPAVAEHDLNPLPHPYP